jgi:hypothetical protein
MARFIEAVKNAFAKMTPEKKAQRVKKAWANLSPEQREARIKKAWESRRAKKNA